MSLLVLTMLTACEPVLDGYEGPSEQWEGLVSVEESNDDEASDDLDGDIDTGLWEDPAEDDPPDDTEEEVVCTASDLLFVAEIEDADGDGGSAFVAEDDLFFTGRTVNPCDGAVTLTTASSCLVNRWEIKDAEGITQGLKPDCSKGAWEWRLEPGDELLQTSSSRRFPAGDYTLTVRFNAEPYVARLNFTVE